MRAIIRFFVKQVIKMRGFAAFILLLTGITNTFAYYPGGPWGMPYNPSYNNYGPVSGYPYSNIPGYFRGVPYQGAPWYRPFAYNRPWGRVNGGMAPDGSFWINISIGGRYQDLQTLMAIMQMSGSLQMGSGGQPQQPLDFTQYNNNLWPM